jgi:L-alanine-DL-glutamate epimerase-like enolase superfamily enzyme
MKIRDVSVKMVTVPLEKVFKGGTYQIEKRCTLVVKMETDEGITGEIYSGDEKVSYREIRDIIVNEHKELLIGEDPFAVERIWARLFETTPNSKNKSVAMRAIAAVDMANWDVIGKALDTPLYRLLGGAKSELPIIGYTYYGDSADPQEIADMVVEQKELGYAGTKLKVGRIVVADDVKRVEAIVDAVGDDVILACDANMAWTPEQAIEFASAIVDLNIAWFEEPIRWYQQADGMRWVREATGIPVCAGQSESSGFGCFDLMRANAVDYLNVDASICGGVTEWKRIAATAQYFDVGMVHHEEPQVALHLLAAVPHSYCAELFPDPLRDPVWHQMFVNHPEPRNGMMSPPDGPGLGIQIDPDFVKRYEET